MLFLDILHKPFSCYRQKEVVTFGIEVCGVIFALEVLLAESRVAHLNDAVLVVVHEDRDMMFLANLLYDFAHMGKARAIDIPRSDIANFRFGTMLLNPAQKNFQRVRKHLQ